MASDDRLDSYRNPAYLWQKTVGEATEEIPADMIEPCRCCGDTPVFLLAFSRRFPASDWSMHWQDLLCLHCASRLGSALHSLGAGIASPSATSWRREALT
jgi:hypothetical protein